MASTSSKVSNVRFIEGNVANCLHSWKQLFKCPWIAETVGGLKIPFYDLPIQKHPPFPFKAFTPEREIITQEINKLHEKGVVVITQHSQDKFLSNVFLRPKPNGEHRMILDLMLLNEFVIYKHF